jgi:hypothetical protein
MKKFLELHEAGSILATLEPVMPEDARGTKDFENKTYPLVN